MEGIKNTLQFLYDNWTNIVVCLGLIAGMVQQTKDYMSKSKEERIKIAKSQIKVTMLDMITKAEVGYSEWNKSGSVKRSQVIKEIFDEYPILSKVADQDELLEWIDAQIDNSLKTLRSVINQ